MDFIERAKNKMDVLLEAEKIADNAFANFATQSKSEDLVRTYIAGHLDGVDYFDALERIFEYIDKLYIERNK